MDAGADARWYDPDAEMLSSAIVHACSGGHLSTVDLLLHHDKTLLELANDSGWTPLFVAVFQQQTEIVQCLLDRGANVNALGPNRMTALIGACHEYSLDMVRVLLNAGADVEARTPSQQTALHHAVLCHRVDAVRELILQYNANMFAVDKDGDTPFDWACRKGRTDEIPDLFLELYGNKMTAKHGRLTLHVLLRAAEYSFAETSFFHPPWNPLRIYLPPGNLELKVKHVRTLFSTLDTELIRNRDDSGMLPIHIACDTNAPVDILSVLVERDSATLHIADNTGALPIHLLCGNGATAEYASIRYLIEQGGVGTLTARNHEGELPIHILCFTTDPPLRIVQYLIHAFPMSVSMRTNAAEYPFMIAADEASLSVVYEMVRVYPSLVVSR